MAALLFSVLGLILLLEIRIMSQLDDLKAAQAETQASLATTATALTEIGTDLDDLIALVSASSPDLTEVLAQAQAIRDGVKAQADAATAAAGKFTPEPPVV